MKKKIWWSLLSLVILGAIIYVYKIYLDTKNLSLDSQQKQKAVKNLLGHDPIQLQPVITGEQAYNGKNFSLNFPKAATIYHLDPTYSPSPSELETFLFQELHPRLFFAISVLNRPEMQKIQDFSSVDGRLKQTDKYLSKPIVLDGITGVQFIGKTPTSDTHEFERSAFFYQKGKVYSFALTGNDMDEINLMFDQVMNSLQFI